ncbi:sensor histidine kinase [Enterococcus sp. HY326]|uniref:sensor histidine kinase n=1 Tax=Enterococcus sp. HY326 TaxID=2971265 RepID=UPI0022407AB7|nr:HAMP domain-containing sensor histidine kinase [Enterococcus sp. HY326]
MLWLMTAIALILVVILAVVLSELKKYHDQLAIITDNETNLELKTHSRLRSFQQIVLLNNQMIRNHKQARHQLVNETKQLEQAIHNISHDLRTPLTVAGGYVQLLEKDDQATEKQQELLRKISTNLGTVEQHLEQLLNYQRLIEDQIQPTFAEVNVSRLLQEELLNLYQSFVEADIEMAVDIQPELSLITDSKLLRRIFQNILGNILNHGTEAASLQLKESGNQLILIAENHLATPILHPEKLTERFYTEDLSRQSQNSGLGLFIVKELVIRLSGKMTIQAQAESFKVTIVFFKKAP